jgi:plastocyanin
VKALKPTYLAVLAVAGVCLAVAASALAGSPRAAAAAQRIVTIQGYAFRPGAVSVHPGGAVRWTWRDGSTPHNVSGPGFRSRIIAHGTFTVRFSRGGTFAYTCTIHPFMRGRVIVR